MFSMEHFYDGWEKSNKDKLSTKIAAKIVTLIKNQAKAKFYIQGCTYYFLPLDKQRYGFGSGNLDIEFQSIDNLEKIKREIYIFLDKGFTEEIYYGGCDTSKSITEKINTQWEI